MAVLYGCGSASSGGRGGQMPSGVAGSGTASALSGAPMVYVGSTDGEISLYRLDVTLGQLSLVKSIDAGSYPSFIAFDPSHAHAYAVNEPDGTLASFSVDAKTGELTFLNRVSSGGDGPAFVAVDRSGRYVMAANYGGGTTRIFSLGADGSLGAPTDDKAPGTKTHMIITDPANRFAFVMNLGSDTIVQYAFDAAHGTLRPNAVPSLATTKGAGPRHMAFHPSGKFAYVINELDQTLSSYSYAAARGQLTWLQSVSTLANGTSASGVTSAEVAVAPSGHFVYGSNRSPTPGASNIATFAVDAATGKLKLLGNTPSGGDAPRSFTLSADGKLMLVANESGNVVSFAVDVASGALHELRRIDVPPKPQFVGIVSWPVASVR